MTQLHVPRLSHLHLYLREFLLTACLGVYGAGGPLLRLPNSQQLSSKAVQMAGPDEVLRFRPLQVMHLLCHYPHKIAISASMQASRHTDTTTIPCRVAWMSRSGVSYPTANSTNTSCQKLPLISTVRNGGT